MIPCAAFPTPRHAVRRTPLRMPAAALLLAMALLAGGCSGLRGSAPSGQEQRDAAVAAQMLALQQDNQTLRQQQAQSQRQMEALTQQLAQEQEAQRRYRLMMSTNFDLLEKSVSQSLAKPDGTSAPIPPSPSAAAATGTAPAPMAAVPGQPASGAHSAAPGAATAAMPVTAPTPAAPGVRLAVTQATPPAAAALAPPVSLAQAAQPATPVASTPAASASVVSTPVVSTPAISTTGPTPLRAVPLVGKPSLAEPRALATSAQPQGLRVAERREPTAPAKTPALSLTAALLPAIGGAEPRVDAAPAGREQPFDDPDLRAPAHPRQLSANRAAKPLYDRGFALYGSGQYDEALLVYENFLTRYPQDLYSDNAQFWIGECYLHLNRLDQAEAAYRKVLREYDHRSTQEGYKTPDAIYRLAQLSERRHDERKARYYLRAVAERFPESASGQRAQRELQSPDALTSRQPGARAGG